MAEHTARRRCRRTRVQGDPLFAGYFRRPCLAGSGDQTVRRRHRDDQPPFLVDDGHRGLPGAGRHSLRAPPSAQTSAPGPRGAGRAACAPLGPACSTMSTRRPAQPPDRPARRFPRFPCVPLALSATTAVLQWPSQKSVRASGFRADRRPPRHCRRSPPAHRHGWACQGLDHPVVNPGGSPTIRPAAGIAGTSLSAGPSGPGGCGCAPSPRSSDARKRQRRAPPEPSGMSCTHCPWLTFPNSLHDCSPE